VPRAGRREWIGLGVIALPCLLYSMDLTVLHLAVPHISEELKPSSAQLLWIIDIYGFLVAGALITMGTLGDRIGRRRLLLIGATAFGIASILAAFSTSAEMLIGTRALLGLAGATVAPSTLSLIRNMFLDPQQRTFAVGVWITSYSVGGAIGPLIGGVLLEFFWWGSVFLISVPVMLLVLAVGPILLPEYRDPNAGRSDVLSAGLSLTAVLSVILGLKQIAQDGVALTWVAFILGGFLLAALFIRRQLKLTDPFIDLRLFRLPAFSASLAAYGLAILVMFGGFLFLPQYLQLVVGLSPFEAGVWTLPWALAFVIGSLMTPLAVRRIQPAHLMSAGLAFATVGFAMLAAIDSATSFVFFAAGTFAFSLGMSPVFTLTTDLIIGSAPAERAGAASAISETSAEFGGALGIALFGSIGVAVYRSLLDRAIPGGVPLEMAEAARSTLGGALTVAGQLDGEIGQQMASAAQTAFLKGLRICAAISVAGSAALSIFAATTLRTIRPASHSDAPSDQHAFE
jgi:DHA2 family multidrug resistance protein-like MFS transporter